MCGIYMCVYVSGDGSWAQQQQQQQQAATNPFMRGRRKSGAIRCRPSSSTSSKGAAEIRKVLSTYILSVRQTSNIHTIFYIHLYNSHLPQSSPPVLTSLRLPFDSMRALPLLYICVSLLYHVICLCLVLICCMYVYVYLFGFICICMIYY